MELKERILAFRVREWLDIPTFNMRKAYREELYNLLREANWYICDAERNVYTLDDMNHHMRRA